MYTNSIFFLFCRYFARLSLDFEVRMELYRQQIEEMESHLASLHQPSLITPQGRLYLYSVYLQDRPSTSIIIQQFGKL